MLKKKTAITQNCLNLNTEKVRLSMQCPDSHHKLCYISWIVYLENFALFATKETKRKKTHPVMHSVQKYQLFSS